MTTSRFLLTGWTWNYLAALVAGGMIAAFVISSHSALRQGDRRIVDGGSRIFSLCLGLAVVALALLSPIAVLTAGYLFSAHMMQHLLLLLIAPALLLLSLPAWRAARVPPPAGAGALQPGRRASLPCGPWVGLTWLAGVGSMWLWHAPPLCNAATTVTSVHWLQVVSLLLLGVLFWWPILGPRRDHHLPVFAGIGYLVSACLACTVLGVIVTFSPVNVCPVYLHPADHLGILPLIRDQWGLSPSVDQQLGGLMMWVPSCLVYLSAVLGLLARYYASDPVGTAVPDRAPPPQPLGGITPKPLNETS